MKILCEYINNNYNDVQIVISDRCTSNTLSALMDIYKDKNIKQIPIPANYTKYVKPLVVSIFKFFKVILTI